MKKICDMFELKLVVPFDLPHLNVQLHHHPLLELFWILRSNFSKSHIILKLRPGKKKNRTKLVVFTLSLPFH